MSQTLHFTHLHNKKHVHTNSLFILSKWYRYFRFIHFQTESQSTPSNQFIAHMLEWKQAQQSFKTFEMMHSVQIHQPQTMFTPYCECTHKQHTSILTKKTGIFNDSTSDSHNAWEAFEAAQTNYGTALWSQQIMHLIWVVKYQQKTNQTDVFSAQTMAMATSNIWKVLWLFHLDRWSIMILGIIQKYNKQRAN